MRRREESPTSHVIYEIVPQPMTGEQMATTSCSSPFVYHDCLITSLPKRGDNFFWSISSRCRHYFLPQEPKKLDQHLGQNLKPKIHEGRLVDGEENFHEEEALWSRSLLPLHLHPPSHTQGASLWRKGDSPYRELQGTGEHQCCPGMLQPMIGLSRRALGDEDVSQWQST